MKARSAWTISLALLAVAVLAWLLVPRTTPDVGPHQPRSDRPEPGGGSAAGAPGIVRIVVAPPPGEPSKQGRDRPPTVLEEVEHLGPLTGGDLEDALEMLALRRRNYEKKLADRHTDSQDSASLKEEAELLWEVTLAKEAGAAMRAGSYVVTRPGQPSPSLALPGAEVMRTGGTRNGENVNVTIIVSLHGHPEMAQARQYFDAIMQFDDSERVRKFNSLPDEERSRLAAQLGALLRKPHRTQDELKFIHKWIGVHTKLLESSGMVQLLRQ